MAVPVIASATGIINNAGTQIVFTKSTDYSGIAVGDLLLVSMFLAGSASMTPTLPTNWAIPTGATVAYNATWAVQRYVAWRVADAADVAATSFTFDISAGPTPYGAYASITLITGAHATTPINGTPTSQSTSTGTTGTFSGVTTSVADCLIFLSGGLTYSSGSPPSGSQFPNIAPTGTTISVIIDDDPNLGYLGTAYYTQAIAGATGTKPVALRSLSSSAGILQAVTVAIAPASTGITGTVAVTDGADTSSATAAAKISGAVAVTEAADTNSATGAVKIAGTVAASDADDTSSATGAVSGSAITGTVAVTDGADTSSATATARVSGTAAATDGDDTSNASGTVGNASITGTVAVSDGADTSAATGAVRISGAAAVNDNDDTTVATGAVRVSGTVAVTDGADVSNARQPALPITGTVAANDDADVSEATGFVVLSPGTYPESIAGGGTVVLSRLSRGGSVVTGSIPSSGLVVLGSLRGRP